MSVAAAGTVRTITAAALRRVLLNGAALLGAYVVPRSLTFIAALFAARVLQPAAFGAYGAAAALAMMLSIVCTLGMLPLLVRDIVRSPADAAVLVAAAHRVKLLAGAAMLVLLGGAGALAGLEGEALLAALLLGVGHAAWGLAENYGARLQAEERMGVWLRANIVFGVCSGVFAGAAVLLTSSIAGFCAGFAAGQCLALLYLAAREPILRVDGERLRAHVQRLSRATLPFALAFLVLTIFYKFDVLLLARLRDAYAAGIYAAGYKLIDVLHALAVVAAAAVYPRLARSGGGAGAVRTLELFLLGAVPAAGVLWLARVPLVAALFGADYAATAVALRLLAPAAALLVVNIAAGYVLALAGRLQALAASYGAALVLKLVLGVLWMPVHGAAGAAAAMLCGEALAAAALLVALRNAGVVVRASRAVASAVAASAWLLACARLAPAAGIALFGTGVVVLYAAAGVLTPAERSAISELFRRRQLSMVEPT